MKESEYLDLMNGLDARYPEEAVSRLSGNAIPDSETAFTAVPVTRTPRRIFAGVMTAFAAAACVFAVTVLLPKLGRGPESVNPASSQPGTDFERETAVTDSTEENPVSWAHTMPGETEVGCTDTAPGDAVATTLKTHNNTMPNTGEGAVEYTTSGAVSAGATVTGVTSNLYTTTVIETPQVKLVQNKLGYYVLEVQSGYHASVRIKAEDQPAFTLNASQSAHIVKLMADEKLEPCGDKIMPSGASPDKYLDERLTVELIGTDICWELSRFKVADLNLIQVDGVYYQGKTADAAKQIRQYAQYCMDGEEFVIHLPADYSGYAVIFTIACTQNPVILSQEDTGYILKQMTEAKLTEIPTPELPCGGPISVNLGFTQWDIYTEDIVSIDNKFYRDSTGALAELERYALGFLGGERPE